MLLQLTLPDAIVVLTRDQSVRWSFQAAAPLNFNIHYHEGKKVEYPAKQDGVRESQGTLPVPLDQDCCWMWVNKSGVPISLQVQLARKRQPHKARMVFQARSSGRGCASCLRSR